MSFFPVRLQPSSAQIDQGLHDLILGLDRLRVGLVVALLGDHVDQLGGEVDVRFLDRAGLQFAQIARARHPHQRLAGGGRFGPEVAAERVEALRAGEVGEHDLAEVLRLPVAVTPLDDPVGIDRGAGQAAGGKAVLHLAIDAEDAAILGAAGEIEIDAERRGGAGADGKEID